MGTFKYKDGKRGWDGTGRVRLGLISSFDDEFFELYEGNFSENQEFLYEQYELFDTDAMDETECKAEFRFGKTEILLLAEARDIPETFVCR